MTRHEKMKAGRTTSALLLLACLSGAFAQEIPPAKAPPPAAQEEPATVFSKEYKAIEEPTPLAQALELAFGATFFAEVKISTANPVRELSRLNNSGFYKLELIELLLMSAKAKQPLDKAVSLRKKGETLSAIAVSYGLIYDDINEAALAVQEIVDRDYLPRFPERRPRRDRDEP